jgi:uncharacterized membrane protein (UPF0127 family)
MSRFRQIIHEESGRILVAEARWCDSFTSKLRGFMFRRQLQPGDGLVLVDRKDNRLNSSIHMLFVFMPLGVVWVNDTGEVVDTVVAQPWRLSYAPQAPARYVVEAGPAILEHVHVGDHIQFAQIDA